MHGCEDCSKSLFVSRACEDDVGISPEPYIFVVSSVGAYVIHSNFAIIIMCYGSASALLRNTIGIYKRNAETKIVGIVLCSVHTYVLPLCEQIKMYEKHNVINKRNSRDLNRSHLE